MADPAQPEWLTRREAAAYARVSVSTIDRALKAGSLRSTKPNRRRLIHREWLDHWLAGAATMLLLFLLFLALLVLPLHSCGGPGVRHHHRQHAVSRMAVPTQRQARHRGVRVKRRQ